MTDEPPKKARLPRAPKRDNLGRVYTKKRGPKPKPKGRGKKIAAPRRPRVEKPVEEVNTDGLKEWQLRYAEWLTGYEGTPGIAIRVKRASALAGYIVKPDALQKMEAKPDFLLACGDVLKTDVASARKLAQDEAHRTVEQWIAMKNLAFQDGNYKEFSKYANPILDRLWPKTIEGEQRPPQVVINMAGNFAAEMIHTSGDLKEESRVLLLPKPE